jgi:8-oxo-dGTP diphosphatase
VPFTYEYPRPAVTVDCVVFGLDEEDLKVLLIQRDVPPFRGQWALPGGFVRMDEDLEQAARRELREETGVSLPDLYLEQLYTFGGVDRDPRFRVVSVAYYALVNLADHRVQAGTDAKGAAWFAASDLPRLAFDHAEILSTALRRLKGKVRYEPVGFELLPPKFTLTQLQKLYEIILERPLDKRNFRKKVLKLAEETGILVELDEVQQDVAHRAARLWRFDEEKYRRMKRKGINFEI